MDLRASLSPRRPLSRAALLVALEGLGLLALGLVYAVRGIVDAPQSRAGTELGALLIGGSGVLLLLLARALAAARAWARSPVVVAQLLGLLTAFSLTQGGLWAVALVVAVLSAGTLQALGSAEAREAFRSGRSPRD